MRKALVVLSLGVLGTGLAAGCGWGGMDPCVYGGCPPPDDQCDGLCVPYMDSTWDMALVGMEVPGRVPLHCPEDAPFAGMSGKEVPSSRSPARDVLACNVNPRPTCSSAAFVCVPFDPVFAPCVLQPGDQICPDTYALATTVQSAAGHTVTVCCEGPDDGG
jgi:hypothetical protein